MMRIKIIFVCILCIVIVCSICSCAGQGHAYSLTPKSLFDHHLTKIELNTRIDYDLYDTFAMYNCLWFATKESISIEVLKENIELNNDLLTEIVVNDDEKTYLLIYDINVDSKIRYTYMIEDLGIKNSRRIFRFTDLRVMVIDKDSLLFYKTIFFPLYLVKDTDIYTDVQYNYPENLESDWEHKAFSYAEIQLNNEYEILLSFNELVTFYENLGIYEITTSENYINIDDIRISYVEKDGKKFITVTKLS